MVGVLVPLKPEAEELVSLFPGHRVDVDVEEFDWLGWMERPPSMTKVAVLCLDCAVLTDGRRMKPPCPEWPILQSHVDTILEVSYDHSPDFAKEWMDTIKWWTPAWLNDRINSRRPWTHEPKALEYDEILQHHPPGELNMFKHRCHGSTYHEVNHSEEHTLRLSTPEEETPPRASRRVVKNFLFGFGSIIQTKSRASSDKSTRDAAPCRIKAEFGYIREWNFQASTAQICALGLRRAQEGERGATINGVLFPAPDDMNAFDRRENGYQRVQVPREHVELLSWQTLPQDADVYLYVPYAPKVVEKYGKDEAGYPKCSGPSEPEGLLASEKSGLGLEPPSEKFPILQTYIDVVLDGCLEHGEDFAREFIRTTFLWTPFWCNEREVSRRPWLHTPNYVKMDQLLMEELPEYFPHRKLDSEYAVYMQ